MRAEEINSIIRPADLILVTGAAGFIGSRLVGCLLKKGFLNLRCFLRHSSDSSRMEETIREYGGNARVEILRGNLLSKEDCLRAAKDAAVIYHLAAEGGKSFPGAFLNCVVTTRNLLHATLQNKTLKRFVNTSSFAVYSNRDKPRRSVLDESCPLETDPVARGDAYCFAKIRQDELVAAFAKQHGLSYVLVRPGVVYGPGKERIHGRVGLDTFGIFLHLGGSNPLPLTQVENCAEVIALAGLQKGIDGEVFNVIDDDLPSSRQFLRMYKRQVRRFPSLYLPPFMSYLFCLLWEKYSVWSEGQLPPIHNRREWSAYWRHTNYSNQKAKRMLNWTPKLQTSDGLSQFFQCCREKESRA